MRKRILFSLFTLTCFIFLSAQARARYVTIDLEGQLGNQMFQVAATLAHAKKLGSQPLFPDFKNLTSYDLPYNYEHLFHFLCTDDLPYTPTRIYREKDYNYRRLPPGEGLLLRGYFFSELYFKEIKDEILTLYSPSSEMLDRLRNRWGDLLTQNLVVGVHIRTYHSEDPSHRTHVFIGWDYFKCAMNHFPEETHFLICSDRIDLCKKGLSDVDRHITFVEDNKDHIEDFYLLTLCDHNILSNSTFSWWSAYLNKHPNQVVIAPDIWFPTQNKSEITLLPEHWIKLPYTPSSTL